MELGQRIEVAEKLRTQVRDLEKEKRDLHRRYNEQVSLRRPEFSRSPPSLTLVYLIDSHI